MLFSTDCAFRIGSTHKICQDYGISGIICDTAYAVIADGCSGSDLSEFGAKLLCKAIENEIVENEFKNFTSNSFIINSDISLSKVFSTLFEIGNKLKMPDCWLDATLAYAIAKQGVAQIYFYGDGVIVREWPDGTSTVVSIEYPSGYPFFLNYITTSNRKRFDKWKSIPNQKKVVLTYHLDENGNLKSTEEEYYDLSSSSNEKDLSFNMSILDFENSKLALFTDGIKSFFKIDKTDTSKVNIPVSMIEVIPSLMKIKSFKGQFANRRLNKFLQKENILYFDDVTMAVIKMGQLDESSCSGKRNSKSR